MLQSSLQDQPETEVSSELHPCSASSDSLSCFSCSFISFSFSHFINKLGASLIAQLVKNPLAMQETWVQSLGWEDPLWKGKATHYPAFPALLTVSPIVTLLINYLHISSSKDLLLDQYYPWKYNANHKCESYMSFKIILVATLKNKKKQMKLIVMFYLT